MVTDHEIPLDNEFYPQVLSSHDDDPKPAIEYGVEITKEFIDDSDKNQGLFRGHIESRW